MSTDTSNQDDDPLADLDRAMPDALATGDEINASNVDAMITHGLSASRNLIATNESPEKYGTTFADLLKLEKGMVGLRRVPGGEEQLRREAAEGTEGGDAVCLSNVRNFLPDDEVPAHVKDAEKKFKASIAINNFHNKISPEGKTLTIQGFERGLHAFIGNSIPFSTTETLETGAMAIDKLTPQFAFLIINTGTVEGYEADGYQGFGKMGSKGFEGKDVYVQITPQEAQGALAELRSEYESKPPSPNLNDNITDVLCKLVIDKVKVMEVDEPEDMSLLI